jgi:pimeloyl-ACP methyl ester carboxylesterase
LKFADIDSSPLAPGVSPVRLRYREFGEGQALVLLHGGWGYAIYPFDRQIAALEATHRIIAPDRTGYGGSGPLMTQEVDFHRRAARETLALLDALDIDHATFWGHSDGAIIALLIALAAPKRVDGIVAEATHFFKRKPASRAFFETMRDAPGQLGDRVTAILAEDHGPRWDALISLNGAAWLGIGGQDGDLYEGRLGDVRAPVLVLHGARDPRTEPGELDALMASLGPAASLVLLPEGGHSPHSERATADDVTRHAVQWMALPARAR